MPCCCKIRDTILQTPLWQQIVITAEDGGLKSIFDLANVHADIFRVITGGEGILTLRECVSSWELRNYEHRLTRWIDRNVPSCKGRRVEGSRLKLAWKAGFDRIQNDDNLTKNGGPSGTKKEDWEDELPSGEKEKMEEAFNNMYHIVVDNPVFPCDPLTNRIWREFRRWQMSVTATSQMKSLLCDQAPKTSERTQLGEHTTVISELPNAFVPKHVVEYHFGLRTWMNAWDRCGNYLVDSKSKPGTHVLMMPWDATLNYADRGLRIVTSSGIAPSEQLQWWERKDRITRGAIAGLVRQRWLAQGALEKALADTNTDWTVIRGLEVKGIHTAMEQADQGLELGKGAGRGKGVFRDQKWRGRFPAILDRNKGPAPLPSSSNDRKTWNNQVEQKAQNDNPQKRQRRIGNSSSFTPSGKKLCGAFNSAQGCPDERYCPQKALHRCNIITSTDGRVCFATDHGAHQHRS